MLRRGQRVVEHRHSVIGEKTLLREPLYELGLLIYRREESQWSYTKYNSQSP